MRAMNKERTLSDGQGRGACLLSSVSEIVARLEGVMPFALIKIGQAELHCLLEAEAIKKGERQDFSEAVKKEMKESAGFYPPSKEALLEYASLYEARMANADLIGSFGLAGEAHFIEEFAPKAKVIDGKALNPLIGKWSHALAGKKVLVIYPFTDEIAFQYDRREKVFQKDPSILPAFDLRLLASPITMGDVIDPRFPTFMHALEEIETRLANLDFDVVLVGCGAYGSLIAMAAKKLGKKAIQTGGSTQLLFGILGKRWENAPYVAALRNEFWIHPTTKPLGYEKVCEGAYW